MKSYISSYICPKIRSFMLRTKTILHYLTIILLVWAVAGCQKNTVKTYKTSTDFFAQAQFGGDYFKTLPYNSPDSLVERIATDVPQPWAGAACESAYFHLPDDVSDSLLFIYLDKFETTFPNDSVRAFSQLMRGHLFSLQARYDTAEVCLKECYDISTEGNRPIRASDAQIYMGDIASVRGDYPEAIRLQTKAYQAFMRIYPNDGGRVYEAAMTIGRAYLAIEDYESAKVWHKKLVSLVDTNPETRGMYILALAQLSVDFSRNQQHDSAKILIDSTFLLKKRYNHTYEQCIHHFFRAEIATASGECQAAIPDFRIAQNDPFCATVPGIMARINRGLASAYACIGRTDSAIFLYTAALKTSDTLSQAKIYLNLATLYEKQGKYKLALDYERRSHDLRDRILTTQKDKALERMTVNNETAQQMQKIEYQQKTTRLRLIIALLFFVALLISALSVVYRQKQKQLILVQEKALAEVRERLNAQALVEAEKRIETQETNLQASAQLLSFKDKLIENLQIKLVKQTETPTEALNEVPIESVGETATHTTENTASLRSMRMLTVEDWAKFRELFDSYFPDFSVHIKDKFPQLTISEVRLILLIKVGFEPSEMASVLGISYQSVYTSRYRLRKKLNLQGDLDLQTFILTF